MAYYSYNYHQSYFPGESYQTPYGGNYDIVPSQALVADYSHEFSNQNFFEYSSSPYYYGAYDPPVNRSVVAYSAYSFTEPKSVEYDPYSGGYSSAVPQFSISYSVSNVDDDIGFEEYDPTPYGGGYDLDLTYGKPLAPSEAICYPRSSPDSSALPLKENVEESAAKPHIETKPTPATEENKEQLQAINGDEQNKESDDAYDSSPDKRLGQIQGEVGHDGNCDEDNSYEDDERVTQIPPGYGLEAVDLCESFFGYWPCLDRHNKGGHGCQQVACNEESSYNQWKETADYLFGSSYPYGERRDGDPIYCYDRYLPGTILYGQVEYDEDSWTKNF